MSSTYVDQFERIKDEYEREQEALEKGEVAYAAEQVGKAIVESIYSHEKETRR